MQHNSNGTPVSITNLTRIYSTQCCIFAASFQEHDKQPYF